MAQVSVDVGGNSYQLNCRDGEEDQLRAMAAIVDQKAGEGIRAVGRSNEARTLLFASLLLADDLQDARGKISGALDEADEACARLSDMIGELEATRAALVAARAEADGLRARVATIHAEADGLRARAREAMLQQPAADPAPARAMEGLAERVEALADRLEKAGGRA